MEIINKFPLLGNKKLKNMKISVKLQVSEETNNWTFDLEDLGITSQEEWDELSIEEKDNIINELVNDLPDQPYWVMESFSEKD